MVRLQEAILKVQTNQRQAPHRQRQRSNSNSRTRQTSITITGDKLSLNYQEITSLKIERTNSNFHMQETLNQFLKVKKLFLSHNSLETLDGIELFPNLTHLSISHNKLKNIEELSKVNATSLQCLAIKSNYFVERHPDHKTLLVNHFGNLRELDSIQVGTESSQSNSIRGQVREGHKLRHVLIPFLIKLDQNIQALANQLHQSQDQITNLNSVQAWNKIFSRDFSGLRGNQAQQARPQQQKAVTCTQVMNFIGVFDQALECSEKNQVSTASRRDLHDLFQWLYQEIILKLSIELHNTDLVKYLNYKILSKYPQLASFLAVKNQIELTKQFEDLDHKMVEKLCQLLDHDDQILLEVLLTEQLNMFYTLQPEVASLPNPQAQLVVVDQTENREPVNKEMFDSICEAVERARSESKSPGKYSLHNSNAHPRQMQATSAIQLQNLKGMGREEEFSFREKPEVIEQEKSMNEQSFLIVEQPRVGDSVPKPLGQETHPSQQKRTERAVSPNISNLFRVKQNSEAEILPNKTDLPQEIPKPLQHNLKMQIPQNYLQRSLIEAGKQNCETDDSFQNLLTPNAESQLSQSVTRDVLGKFIQGNSESLKEAKAFLDDKTLSQFPIFALNEDYMRAIALIIQEKIERAKILVKQISSTAYLSNEQQEKVAQREQPKERLTSEQKSKLSIIKKKVQEKREQQRADPTQQRGYATTQSAGGGRSRSGARLSSGGRSDTNSAYSPVTRHHRTSRERLSSDINQNRRILASEAFKEQADSHRQQTDEESIKIWVRKQQQRSIFGQKMSKIGKKVDWIAKHQVKDALTELKVFSQRLQLIEQHISARHNQNHRAKVFFFWFCAYKEKAELTRGLHALRVKQKVFTQFDIIRKQAQLNLAKVDAYYRQKLQLKSFFSLLKYLDKVREKKHEMAMKQRKEFSPQNPYKRQSPQQEDAGGVGLIKVKAVMDKNIDGVYEGPLAQAVKTVEDDAASYRNQEDDNLDDARAPVSFQGTGFSFTNALIQARKKELGNAYHKKQVNFFQSGGVYGQTVSKKNREPSARSKRSNSSGKSNRKKQTPTNRSILKNNDSCNRSMTHNASSKWSVVNQPQNADIFGQGNHVNQTTAISGNFSMSHQTSFGAHMNQTSMTHLLPPQASRCSMDDPSHLQSRQNMSQVSIRSSSKSKRKKSTSKSRSRSKSQTKHLITEGQYSASMRSHQSRNPTQTERLNRKNSNETMQLRSQKMITTFAKEKKKRGRSGSRSAYDAESSTKKIQVFGQLSKAIMDPQPKIYEKNTVCFISKQGSEKRSTGDSVSKALRGMRNIGGHSQYMKQPTQRKASQKLLVK